MGEAEFIHDLEKLFEDHPMQKESIDAILSYQVISVDFYARNDDSYASMIRMPSGVCILLNVIHDGKEVEKSFAHELAHANYDRRVSRLFSKYKDDYFETMKTGISICHRIVKKI